MTLDAPRQSFALDPLIAEAKHRMRRRRLLLLAVLVVAAVGLAFVLKPWGGPGPARPAHGVPNVAQALAQLTVPANAQERHWLSWIEHQTPHPPPSKSSVLLERRQVSAHAAASGATVVRLKIWRTTAPPAPEVVVATAMRPAVYLRHHLNVLFSGFHGRYYFVEVVDRRGRKITEAAYTTREGTYYIRPRLYNCGVVTTGFPSTVPCPVN
jgi:hypothetical protein